MFVEALVRMLVAEHKKNPICGNVLALGKQTVALSLSKIKEIFSEIGCEINSDFKETQDITTRYKSTGFLDDKSFFNLFGNLNYETMDVSDYEQASIIHNLNDPIPKDLEGKFDFIIDGGTFDHLFDLKTCFSNVVKLLKPGGRIFQWNAASNYSNAGYLSFSADFFYDYYTLNKFADCHTFFALSNSISAQNWCFYEFIPPKNSQLYPSFSPSCFYMMVVVLARKGADSTHHRMPLQLQYRDKPLKDEYEKYAGRFSGPFAQEAKLKSISLRELKMSLRYKLLYLCEPKPNRNAYHKIGWL